jgi:UDP-glucuronate decarboxylase
MNILVTGGAGFIGSHLARRLHQEGHSITVIDNLFTGAKDNISDLLESERFTFVEHDITQEYSMDKVDQIYNLACPASPVHYQQDPIKTMKTNILGGFNVLDLAVRTNARVLQASTSEVYGDPDVHPQIESYLGNVNTSGIRACYDEGKRAVETIFFDYHRKNNVDVRVVRIFNTYGPGMRVDDGRVVSNFIVQALRGEDITIYGDGTQTRSFQYVDDLVEGMIAMMNNDRGFTGPVNLGNPNEFTVLELAGKILTMVPASKSKIVYAHLPQDDPRRRQPSIALARAELGWQPRVELAEGLSATIKYFRNHVL